MFVLAAALKAGYTDDVLYRLTKIDKWFLNKMRNIVNFHVKMETLSVIVDFLRQNILHLASYMLRSLWFWRTVCIALLLLYTDLVFISLPLFHNYFR